MQVNVLGDGQKTESPSASHAVVQVGLVVMTCRRRPGRDWDGDDSLHRAGQSDRMIVIE